MKRFLLLLITFFTVGIAYSQVVLNQVDNFEDGTTQNWGESGVSAAPVENVATDGPDGVDDNYLRDYTTGISGGSGSRLIIRNIGNQWSGNFTIAGVESVSLDVRALNRDVNVRISITGPGGKFSSSANILVTAGNGWNQITIPISAADMSSVSDGNDGGPAGTDIAATLAAVSEFRILSSSSPSWRGEITDAELHMDNITALASLSTPEFENQNNEFIISPNPAKNKLNIQIPSAASVIKLEVFDVLGKRVYNGLVTQLESSVNVSNWKSGVYLVRVSNNKITQTKRFIKQ
ncbi:T9SS type A sorting domain-containing protein [uncultured Winogradskyella sp.]|uniref:T9SS type A sorting domain-containing protein n=1 Tax=uncultured Winogradskyella sp. TaxID=395353 RepID=UPI0030D99ECB|tara:strand:+ start:271 stop:1146 length:876 start_codon:yes stop_codon:yes gene_type:complete